MRLRRFHDWKRRTQTHAIERWRDDATAVGTLVLPGMFVPLALRASRA